MMDLQIMESWVPSPIHYQSIRYYTFPYHKRPGFFSRNAGLGEGGGELLLWGEKCEKHPKKQANFVIVWGGEISPLKALKKHCNRPVQIKLSRLLPMNKHGCLSTLESQRMLVYQPMQTISHPLFLRERDGLHGLID